MKFDKQLAIILVLISLLLSAIGISIYFYNKNEQTKKENNQLVKIYVAKNNIKQNTLIKDKDIKETTVAKQYVLTKPLLKQEIINKYAIENIYANEQFLKEKLSVTPQIKRQLSKILDYNYSSYNMSFKLFKNPNYSIQPNDVIKIISVYPMDSEKNNYKVRYVAKNIKVLGFLSDGKEIEKAIYKKKVKRFEKKQQIEEIVDIKSDEMILDIKEDVLLSLISDFNKGNQLWMVKSKMENDTKDVKKVTKIDKSKLNKTKVNKSYKPKKVYYPITWYKPATTYETKTAMITYANDSKKTDIKKAKVASDYQKECSETNKLLLVKSRTVYLREAPSIRAKIDKKIAKNYILPYVSISKINPNWYMICDETYVQRKDVEVITYDDYKRLK
ncbi:MAG: hypothetical protein ACNI25_12855 [Halarcobacter sp.]